MKLLAHAHSTRGSGLVVLIEKDFGPAWDERKNKLAPQHGYYVIWGGVVRWKDGFVFRKTRRGGFSFFRKISQKIDSALRAHH
jgi:hypothetical protein